MRAILLISFLIPGLVPILLGRIYLGLLLLVPVSFSHLRAHEPKTKLEFLLLLQIIKNTRLPSIHIRAVNE